MQKIICIVDDDEDDRYLLREAIKDTGLDLKIIEFEDGHELIDLIQKGELLNISLLITDLNMCKMNGIETIATLKAYPDFTATPAVMISAISDISIEKHAYNAGINVFLVKPNSHDELKTLIYDTINKFIV